ncbi:hypothetical protein AGMMS49942_08390 [Spirochaetia bacterium]|nr:hypothetical protein AGMMS49942_08390 [Spirochaetia bacterium]
MDISADIKIFDAEKGKSPQQYDQCRIGFEYACRTIYETNFRIKPADNL